MNGKVVFVLMFAMILLLGGLFIVAQAPFSPQTQKVEQVLPDDRIPR